MNKKISEVIAKTYSSQNKLSPPFWAVEGHLQTIIGSFIKTPPIPENHAKINIETDDGDYLRVTYIKGEKPIVIYLFHGLGGSINSPYMKRWADIALKLGAHIYLVNHRGCGDGAGLAKGSYHSGRSNDISSVIAYGRKSHQSASHIAIGVSLSANALLLLSAGIGAQIQPDLAIAINAPIDLEKAAINLKSGLNSIYDKHFLYHLKDYLLANHGNVFPDYHLIRDLHDFDDIFTAPFGGFKNREEYYSKCSAKQYLKDISIPTIIITSEDDPFVDVIDYKNAILSDSTLMHITPVGGHIGYLRSHGLGFKFWIDEVIENYLNALIKEKVWAQ